MKQCNKCKETKQVSEFFKDCGTKDGYYTICKICSHAKTMKWREANKDKYNANVRRYQNANKHRRDDRDLKSKYGVTKEWLDTTLKAQDGRCGICKRKNFSTKRRLAVDHCHNTGKVRGIICYNCNRLLYAFDDKELFNAIIEYLAKHKAA